MAEWGSSDICATRVNDLSQGGLNGLYLLNAATVHENGQADTLLGSGVALADWFFAGLTDVANKKWSGD
jgi:hypothetical protein